MALGSDTKQIIQGKCSEFKIGNNSAWRLSGNRFFKLWPTKAPGHDFLISPDYERLADLGMVARLEEYGAVKCNIGGVQFRYGYAYSRLETKLLTAEEVLKAVSRGEVWWINHLYLFFKQIQKAGFLYFDIDWSNFGKAGDVGKLVFFDVDSARSWNRKRPNLRRGNQDFHTLFYVLRRELGENLEIFNVAVLAELYIATVFAQACDDPRVLAANKYGARSYYREGKVDIPRGLYLGSSEKGIVKEFLSQTVELCKRVATGEQSSDEAFDKLRSIVLKALNELTLNKLRCPEFAEIVGLRDEGKWRLALEKLDNLSQDRKFALEKLSELNPRYVNAETLRASIEKSKVEIKRNLLIATAAIYLVVGGVVGYFLGESYTAVGAFLGAMLGSLFAVLYFNEKGGIEGKGEDYVLGILVFILSLIGIVVAVIGMIFKILGWILGLILG